MIQDTNSSFPVVRAYVNQSKNGVVAQFENIPAGGPPPGREICGDAYMDVGGRKRPEQVFEGAAPTADEFKLSHYQKPQQQQQD